MSGSQCKKLHIPSVIFLHRDDLQLELDSNTHTHTHTLSHFGRLIQGITDTVFSFQSTTFTSRKLNAVMSSEAPLSVLQIHPCISPSSLINTLHRFISTDNRKQGTSTFFKTRLRRCSFAYTGNKTVDSVTDSFAILFADCCSRLHSGQQRKNTPPSSCHVPYRARRVHNLHNLIKHFTIYTL